MTVPLRKEIYLVYLFKNVQYLKKEKKQKTREALLFLDTKTCVTEGFLLRQMTIWTTESCDIPSVFVGSTTVCFVF